MPTKRLILAILIVSVVTLLACQGSAVPQSSVPPTATRYPTFTPTNSQPQPVVINTATPTPTPSPSNTPTAVVPSNTPAPTLAPPTQTATPLPSHTPAPVAPTATPLPTDTPTPVPPTDTPVPVIRYVLAGSNREFNCEYTRIFGTVLNANNKGVADVEVVALGIHETTGLRFSTRTDAEGRYETFRIPLPELQSGQWAVFVSENGGEVSERFHWASTPVCQSDDLGHSQVLRVDWKLIE